MTGLVVPLPASGSSAVTVNTSKVTAFLFPFRCKFVSIFE